MGISIASNSAALRALQQLGRNTTALGSSFERLSSGLRINRASDDAAGLAISMGLGKDSRVFGQAIRNANDGISALNIAGEALGGANEILFRLKELATQAASGSLSTTQRLSLDKESQALTNEFNRQIASVNFNGLSLLSANFGRMNIQVGYGNNGTIGFNIGTELDRNLVTGFNDVTEIDAGNAITWPNTKFVLDVNKDGKSDIITSDASGINLILGNGDGTFAAHTSYSFTTVSAFIDVADLNGDGNVDLISGSTTNFLVRYGNGNGTFGSQTSYSPGGSVSRVVKVADFNGDGIMDLAGAATTASVVRIRYGQGNGNFSAATSISTSGAVWDMQVSDINEDGKADLVVKSGAAATADIFLGTSSASMNLVSTISSLGNYNDLKVEDMNYDGRKDIVASFASGFYILNGNGDGTFQAATTISDTPIDTTLNVTDLDGDGIRDIVYSKGGIPMYLRGNGDGTYAGSVSFANVAASAYLLIADLDGDGAKDLMTNSEVSGQIAIARSTTVATTTIQRIDLTSKGAALQALGIIDAAVGRVSGELGAIGSTQSRISSALNTLSAARENSLAAQGRITDTDIAAESANMTRQQILIQSASAVLAQANQIPSLALSLLSI